MNRHLHDGRRPDILEEFAALIGQDLEGRPRGRVDAMSDADALRVAQATLARLVQHDIAADQRAGLPHCTELAAAIETLAVLERRRALS